MKKIVCALQRKSTGQERSGSGGSNGLGDLEMHKMTGQSGIISALSISIILLVQGTLICVAVLYFGALLCSGKSSAAWKAEERRRQLLAILEEGDDADVDWDALAIKGSCQELEKSYFRLTSAPDPATVR